MTSALISDTWAPDKVEIYDTTWKTPGCLFLKLGAWRIKRILLQTKKALSFLWTHIYSTASFAVVINWTIPVWFGEWYQFFAMEGFIHELMSYNLADSSAETMIFAFRMKYDSLAHVGSTDCKVKFEIIKINSIWYVSVLLWKHI